MPEEEARFNAERPIHDQLKGTLTYTETKQFQKVPRLPSTTWEEMSMLLTTYSLFLEMLFGNKNEHLRGVDEVQREVMAMARVKHRLTPSYYANLI